MLVLVGSLAAKHRGIDLRRQPKDIDLICSSADFRAYIKDVVKHYSVIRIAPTQSGQMVAVKTDDGPLIIEAEFTDGDNPSSQLIFDAAMSGMAHKLVHLPGGAIAYTATANMLYMLKMSHRYRKNTPHFLKTMSDIWVMRDHGCEIEDEDLYKARMDATYEYKHPRLNTSKSEFFVNNNGELSYTYDHDTIHIAMAHLGRPMYTYYAKDGEQVLSDRAKFDALPHEQKCMGVIEEAYVLALERSVVPHGTVPRVAFEMALEKVCTSITSGWFREFGWEHYHEVDEMYDDSYAHRFWKAVESGIVKPYGYDA